MNQVVEKTLRSVKVDVLVKLETTGWGWGRLFSFRISF